MKNALILHGTDASPSHNWFTWLKNELEKLDYNVWLPQLPHSERPSTKIYNDFILSNKEFSFTNETIIIGHSSGAVEALSLLEHVESKIKAAFLVSAFKDWLGWESLKDLFVPPLNFEKIKDKSDNFIFIHSDNDPYCPLKHPKYLAEQVSGKVIIKTGQGHFNTELGNQYKQFPELLEIIQRY
jgi:predicted alpha/beta hydrolase family esterase